MVRTEQILILAAGLVLAACTQVDTEAVGGREVRLTTWAPSELPDGCKPTLKELSWRSQTDITNLAIDRQTDGSMKITLGETRSNTEIAQAMARVAEIQIDAQRGTVGDVLNSSVLAQIVGAVLAP